MSNSILFGVLLVLLYKKPSGYCFLEFYYPCHWKKHRKFFILRVRYRKTGRARAHDAATPKIVGCLWTEEHFWEAPDYPWREHC